MPPTGDGAKRVLIVAEAPGRKEDEEGMQLIGEAGQVLRDTLDSFGVDLDRDCVKTNAIICRPPGNKTPTDKQIQACLPNLRKTIQGVDPVVIIPLGGVATKAVLDSAQTDTGKISTWAGFRIPNQNPNAWICPTYHPSFLLRTKSPVLDKLFRDHLKRAFSKCKKKPWKELPQYEKRVRIILNLQEATEAIREMADRDVLTAFDYETNMLKPDAKEARIFSCSIAQENQAIAFPWDGPIIDAMKELLRNNAPKVASNMKFEERWTFKEFGFGVWNWKWDTMLAAHVADNRRGITSIKFLSYVFLGADVYNEKVEAFLKGDAGKPNRIQDIPIRDLLLYNGMDSLYELMIAEKQMGVMDCG
uniref:Putative uracil DNA glycosylase superfamily protein n=1 Tax=viral metagenome TaxID=1070528 RepID=A0A6M3K385_9ZZZZ